MRLEDSIHVLGTEVQRNDRCIVSGRRLPSVALFGVKFASLKLTARLPLNIGLNAPKGKDRIPTASIFRGKNVSSGNVPM